MSGSDAYWPVALKNRSDESIGAKGSQPHLNYQNNHRVRDRKGREPLRFSRTGNPGALKSIAADDVQTSWDTEQQSEREHLHLRSMSARNSGDDEDVHSRDAGVEERVAKAPRTSVGRSASEGRSNVSPREDLPEKDSSALDNNVVGTTGEETRSSRDTRFHVPTRDLAHSEGGSLSQGSQERRSPAEGGHKHGPSPEGRSPGMPRPSAAGGSRAAQFASPSGVEMQQSMPLAKRRTDYSNTQSVEEPIKPSDGQQSSDRREGKPVEVHLSSGKPAVGMYERMRGREPEGYPPRYLHRDRGREPFIEHEVSTGEEAGARSAQTWRDRWIASQSLVDELGEQLIQERMETHRLQTALKAEQGKRKAVNQSSRQSHENMALLRAEKASLEGEVIKIKNQLKMERRAWDADELQLSDKLQQMTSEVEELRHALREAERLKRKLSENLADERHLKERALSFIADRSNRMPYFDMEGPSHETSP